MVEIRGLQKTSLLDYPSKVCSTIFLPSCNFRCAFCFNPDLINNPEKLRKIDEKEFFEFLESRRDWLDGVCITGGEPTLHGDLPLFINKIKQAGFLVKLDTNGSNPIMLEKLINEKLIDYISMDIKAPLVTEKYENITRTNVDIDNIKKSVKLIINSGIEHEFRSTVLPRLHTDEDIVEIAKQISDAKCYFLQQFRPGKTLDESFQKEKPFSDEKLKRIKEECNKFIKTEIRR